MKFIKNLQKFGKKSPKLTKIPFLRPQLGTPVLTLFLQRVKKTYALMFVDQINETFR
jgi:hypothetical protein